MFFRRRRRALGPWDYPRGHDGNGCCAWCLPRPTTDDSAAIAAAWARVGAMTATRTNR